MTFLFLCRGNSARSQMAEGFANHYSNERLSFVSAGTWPSREVHPVAIKVMAERGVDISEYAVKSFTQVPKPIHSIVVLCGQAAEECPTIPGLETENWDVADPAHEGTELSTEKELALFRRVRDEIDSKVQDLLRRHDGGSATILSPEDN